MEKIKQTNLDKYGVEFNFKSTDPKINGRGTYHKKLATDATFKNKVVDKRKNTCIDKYGDDYYYNQIELMIQKIKSKSNSSVNTAFAKYLLDLGIPYTKEYRVGKYIYDFKLGKYLLEIDPYATHNITWSIFNKVREIDYHRNKTLNALENGFICIHVFDWTDVNYILYHLLNKNLNIVDTGKPVAHIFDVKKHELVNKENENTVIIYDDGFCLTI